MPFDFIQAIMVIGIAGLAVISGKALSLLFKDTLLVKIKVHNSLYNTLTSETAKRKIKFLIDSEAKEYQERELRRLDRTPFISRLIIWFFILITWMLFLSLILGFNKILLPIFTVPAWVTLIALFLFLAYDLWNILKVVAQRFNRKLFQE